MATEVEVVGEGPGAGVHALAAEDAGLTRVARAGGVVVVAPSASDRLVVAAEALRRGAVVLVDPPVRADDLVALAAVTGGAIGRLHLGDHARFAPARRAAGPPAGPVRHVSVVVARPPTDGEGPDPVAVLGPGALAAAEQLAGATVAALTVHRPAAGRAVVDLRLTDGGTGSLDLAFDDAAVWQAQVASDDEVVTVELAPLPVAERNGDPLPVDPGPPTRDRRLVDLGYLDQLSALADVHADAAPAHVEDVRRLRLLETD